MKRISATIVAFVMTFVFAAPDLAVHAESQSPTPEGSLKGDVDLDGKVTQVDATFILRERLALDVDKRSILEEIISDEGKQKYPENYIEMSYQNGDVDNSHNGKEISQSDATYILRALLVSNNIDNAFWEDFFKESDSNYSSEKKEEVASSESSKKQSVTVDEKVLVDQNNVKITLKGIEEERYDTNLKLLIENNSEVGLTFSARDTSVNGFMSDASMSVDVAPGKKANSEISISNSDLERCGVNTISDMEFKIHIYNSDNWEDYFKTDVLRVETSAYGSFEQAVDDTGTGFYEQNGIRIIGKGLSDNDSLFGTGLIMYIENNSDKNITVSTRNTSINGFMVDDSMSEDVIAGKKAITALRFYSSSFEKNNITEIESIETSLHIYDMKTWDTIDDTEPITINF